MILLTIALTLSTYLESRVRGEDPDYLSPCNNSGYECCGRKEERNNWKEYHSTSRARKVRSEIVALYCNILKVS